MDDHPHPTSTQYLQRYLFVRQKHVPVQVEEYRGVSLRTRWLADTIEKFTYRPSQSLITKLKLKQHIGVNFKPKNAVTVIYNYNVMCTHYVLHYTILLYCLPRTLYILCTVAFCILLCLFHLFWHCFCGGGFPQFFTGSSMSSFSPIV